ncbi:MAG: hypothetical protein CM1200mP2_43310 [Planctomycetaceae bacterium]|nr:MAG: hypothetical protein CM1200mP2_43310 [Planctomycetaceae bacterium]
MTRRILLAASLCVAVLMTVSVTDAAKEKNPLKGVKCFLKKTKDGKGIPVKKASPWTTRAGRSTSAAADARTSSEGRQMS